jgi:hypothetical protein
MSEVMAFIAGMFVATTVCCSFLVNDTPMYPASMQYSLGFEDGYKKAKEDYKRKAAEGSAE